MILAGTSGISVFLAIDCALNAQIIRLRKNVEARLSKPLIKRSLPGPRALTDTKSFVCVYNQEKARLGPFVQKLKPADRFLVGTIFSIFSQSRLISCS